MRLEGVRLHAAADPEASFERGGPAMCLRHVRDFALKGIEVTWGDLGSGASEGALDVEHARDILIDGFRGRAAAPGRPAIHLRDVEGARVRDAPRRREPPRYGSTRVPSTCRKRASHAGCAGHAGAVTRLSSTQAPSSGTSTHSPPAAVTSGATAG